MKKVLAPLFAALPFVATACPVPDGSSVGGPSIRLLVEPAAVAPGESFTFTVEVSGEETTSSGEIHNQAMVSQRTGCAPTTTTAADGFSHHTYTCTMPQNATNGVWWVQVWAHGALHDGFGMQGTEFHVPVQVTGGVDENGGPQLLGWSTSPATLLQDTVFDLTLTFHEVSLPVKLGNFPIGGIEYPATGIFFNSPFMPNSRVACSGPTSTDTVGFTTTQVWTCRPIYFNSPQAAEAGGYTATPIFVDRLDNRSQTSLSITVTPGTTAP